MSCFTIIVHGQGQRLCIADFAEIKTNKSAQRALVRSPEEKVKGHIGAIYRRPLMLYTKYQGSSRFLQYDF